MNDTDRIRDLEEELDELRNEFRGYVEKKREEESKRLKTALTIAGSIILALGSFIWSEVIWPIIKGVGMK